MCIRNTTVSILLIAALGACSSNEIGNSKDVTQETIYQQYRVSYNEGDEKAEIYAQFRFAGRNGTTLVLNPPSSLRFDGKVIKADSAEHSGAFYKLQQPVTGFYGSHHFVFTDINNKQFDNEFTFDRINLLNIPAQGSTNSALQLSLDPDGLKPGDQIEIDASGTDSSFSVSHTVNTANADPVVVVIPLKEMQRQKGNSVILNISLNREQALQQNTKEGGQFRFEYRLKPVKVELRN